MILLTKMILAHLIGDFLLQPTVWVMAKQKNKLKALALYLHCGLHGVLVMLLVWDWSFLPWAALLVVLHLGIDATKLFLQNKEKQTVYFFADQLAHLISIVAIVYWYSGYPPISPGFGGQSNLLLITLIVFITMPCSWFIKMFITRWSPHTELHDDDSLQNAGKFIGILERLLVFVFVVMGHWEAVGFLLAAKSVFRFGDLKDSKDRKLTEYILIGTLTSFGIAILCGMAYLKLGTIS